jgi:hypothetical protein
MKARNGGREAEKKYSTPITRNLITLCSQLKLPKAQETRRRSDKGGYSVVEINFKISVNFFSKLAVCSKQAAGGNRQQALSSKQFQKAIVFVLMFDV